MSTDYSPEMEGCGRLENELSGRYGSQAKGVMVVGLSMVMAERWREESFFKG